MAGEVPILSAEGALAGLDIELLLQQDGEDRTSRRCCSIEGLKHKRSSIYQARRTGVEDCLSPGPPAAPGTPVLEGRVGCGNGSGAVVDADEGLSL